MNDLISQSPNTDILTSDNLVLHKIQYSHLINNLNALVFIYEIDKKAIEAVNNPTWMQVAASNNIINIQEFYSLIFDNDVATVKEHFENPTQHKNFRIYFRILHKNKNYVSYKCVGNYNEELKAILLTAVESEYFELLHLKQMLESKVEALKETNTYLDEFAYIASHDLQEPLRKLNTYAERLTAKLPANQNYEMYTSRIADSTARMRTLIDDLLSFSRLTKQQLNFENVDLNLVVQKAIEANELKIEETHAEIKTDQLPEIQGIYTQLQQLFFNLINNALKFIPEGRKPLIKIKCDKINLVSLNPYHLPVGEYYKIQIQDNGIGFKQEFEEKIFKLFQRLNSKHEFSGTGIGLAICKRIIENHNGYINAIGKENEGAEFKIILPKRQP